MRVTVRSLSGKVGARQVHIKFGQGFPRGTAVRCQTTPFVFTDSWFRQSNMILLLALFCMQADSSAAMASESPPSHALYYTTAGDVTVDGNVQMSGLFAGHLPPSLPAISADHGPNFNATFSELRQLTFGCAQVATTVRSGLKIQGVSYDPNTGEILIQEDATGRINILRGHLCQTQHPPCTGSSEWSRLQCILCKISNTEQGLIGPFALWNHNIYFIFVPDHAKPHTRMKHRQTLQLRKMHGCAQSYPIFNHLDVNACSQVVATFNSTDYFLEPASELKIVNLGTSGVLYLTQARTYFSGVHEPLGYEHLGVTLIAFHQSTPVSQIHVYKLNEGELDDRYAKHASSNIGSISVHRDIICWGTLDRIHCGQLDMGSGITIKNKVEVLHRGEASLVCMGRAPNVTTGVLVLGAKGMTDITLLFGCSARVKGEGGAGMVRHLMGPDGKQTTTVTPVLDRHGVIKAGIMFVTRGISCPRDPTPTGGMAHHYPSGTASAVDLSVRANLVLNVLLVIRFYL